jgi:hypothetical protein
MACRRARWLSLSPVAGLLSLACSGGGQPAATSITYLPADGTSFADFCSWPSAEATAANDASDGVHGLGPLRVYWNQAPPHGSKAFPVGTLILKETEETDPTLRTIFAMAKVGGGYNSGGAVNWKWFSFKQNPDCSVVTLWSAAPPATEVYAGQPLGDCNGCHEQVSDNDYVWDSALQLSNF